MKIAVLTESPADDDAIHIWVASLLGIETEKASFRAGTRGWPKVLTLLPTLLKYYHYRTDAEGFVVVVDSDDSPIHNTNHEITGEENPTCRYCLTRKAMEVETRRLASVPGRTPMKFAIGVSSPSIEAWYRCGLDSRVNEATWQRKLDGESGLYSRLSLKKDAYGTDRPSVQMQQDYISSHSDRLREISPELETLFPRGFGAMANAIRGWLTQDQ